ncbi:peptidoglycan-binding domain-containing protein [Devosia sp. YIM 151766]|uniref:peptidoglycan-binding domain-containing protein n=1 Tax=Devosia sp. YIM 151766 TaxID=3017325 RepID=UPI00255C476D|nr:peptidoglycan-binding domain-containing protein [Devosia sp. YIM 151766]WIY52425.1 peptidoglycan-binding domain-containing protein [Devosia sp. YIM 151766]
MFAASVLQFMRPLLLPVLVIAAGAHLVSGAAAQGGIVTGGPEPLTPEAEELLREGDEFLENLRQDLLQQLEDFRLEYGTSAPEFLPPLEYDLPFGMPADRNGWRQVQQKLQAAGFYDAAIDGIPGEKTHAALLAYMENLEQSLVDRGIEAIRRGKKAAPWRDGHSELGYGVEGDRAGEFRRVAVDGAPAMQPAGYSGYSFERDGAHIYQFSYAIEGSPDQACKVHNDDEILSDLRPIDRAFTCPLLNGEIILGNGYILDFPFTALGMNIDGVIELFGEFRWHQTPTQIPTHIIE